jgi:hypothetical protein
MSLTLKRSLLRKKKSQKKRKKKLQRKKIKNFKQCKLEFRHLKQQPEEKHSSNNKQLQKSRLLT